jgi:hypothetical protein
METFDGSRSLENMETWLDERVPKPAPPRDHPIPGQTSLTPNKIYNPTGMVQTLGAQSFQDVVASEPTMVKFYAPWCGHCQKLAPSEFHKVVTGWVVLMHFRNQNGSSSRMN